MAFDPTGASPADDADLLKRAACDPAGSAEHLLADLARIVAALRGPGSVVRVTHMVNITALSGRGVAMDEAVVVRPEGSSFRVLGRIAAP